MISLMLNANMLKTFFSQISEHRCELLQMKILLRNIVFLRCFHLEITKTFTFLVDLAVAC